MCQTCSVPLTLPVVPKALGNLRHVFHSSLQAVQRKANQLNFKPSKKVICVLIDGLGAENILARAGHAPFLTGFIKQGMVSHSGFPSTTSANIASFATGLSAGEHGFIGHAVFDREHERSLNLLTGWDETTDPKAWQPNQTVSEMAYAAGIQCNVIGHAEYEHSGYTKATMRQARYLTAESLQDRFDMARRVANSSSESINYLYIPELDKFGHRNGWQSPGWAAILEEVDLELRKLAQTLPKDCGLVITADHGMLDSPISRHVYIDDYVDWQGVLQAFAGDTRVPYLYLKSVEQKQEYLNYLEQYSDLFTAVDAQRAVDANWFGRLSKSAINRLPDILLLAKSDLTLYHSVFSKKRSYDMIAHHGGLTSAETRIPLIRVGI